ncbi:TQXA domain-containing protein [Streptomyces sp. BI20]|uniref:TQXA domain-containing protein n=1 Tax=Streptomyces sp. BI20 TaxID=3403460 RepID=UPI003C7225E9
MPVQARSGEERPSPSGRVSGRRSLAVALLAAALTAAPGAAAVADVPDAAGGGAGRTEGAAAVLDGLKTYGQAVLRDEAGDSRRIPAGLYEMRVEGGGTLQTYGVGLAGFAQPQERYVETPWSGSPLAKNAEAGRIRWVLEHSYPHLNDLAGLAKAAGAGALTAESAAAGTQVAIWRLAEGANVEAADPGAEKLADYLQRSARRLPEPPASLDLEPDRVTGPAGTRLGPVVLRTGAHNVTVTPDAAAEAMGVRVVDGKGRPVTAGSDGTELWFEVPAGTPDGVASVQVQGSTEVPVGRVFTSGARTQAQIVAGSSESATAATATAQWPQPLAVATGEGAGVRPQGGVPGRETAPSPLPSPDRRPVEDLLADSGSSAATPVIASLAVGLVVLGGMVVLALRKRPTEPEPPAAPDGSAAGPGTP